MLWVLLRRISTLVQRRPVRHWAGRLVSVRAHEFRRDDEHVRRGDRGLLARQILCGGFRRDLRHLVQFLSRFRRRRWHHGVDWREGLGPGNRRLLRRALDRLTLWARLRDFRQFNRGGACFLFDLCLRTSRNDFDADRFERTVGFRTFARPTVAKIKQRPAEAGMDARRHGPAPGRQRALGEVTRDKTFHGRLACEF
jgi:hypothetical protein